MKARSAFLASFLVSTCVFGALGAPAARAISRMTPSIECESSNTGGNGWREDAAITGSRDSSSVAVWLCPFREDQGSAETLEHEEINQVYIHGWVMADYYGTPHPPTVAACWRSYNSTQIACGANKVAPSQQGTIGSFGLTGTYMTQWTSHTGGYAYLAVYIDPWLANYYTGELNSSRVWGFWASP